MNLVLFSHPAFLGSQSMPRFARMLESAYVSRGHRVQVWSPVARFRKIWPTGPMAKWAGYIDQYLVFPAWVRAQLKRQPGDTLYVFCDQALGPWVPLVRDRSHVVHVHDLLALSSALGEVPQNPTSWTGRLYQRYIRRGFRQARHFISISGKTQADLHRLGGVQPVSSDVVYNGLNFAFVPMPPGAAADTLAKAGLPPVPDGMLLHLGGGQWYKNLEGVVRLYIEYAKSQAAPLPLWCITAHPGERVKALLAEVPPQGRVEFLSGLGQEALQAAYSRASAFLFPSLAEGFGWPIIEAQACGCPVVTTDAPPMNEIGGPAAVYLPLLRGPQDLQAWAEAGAARLNTLLAAPEGERQQRRAAGIAHAAGFTGDAAIESYLEIYARVMRAGSPRAGEVRLATQPDGDRP